MTYTPPPRTKRHRRYEDKVKRTPEVQELNCDTSADGDIPSCRDNTYNSGYQKQAGSDTYFPSGEDSGYFDRPITDSVMA